LLAVEVAVALPHQLVVVVEMEVMEATLCL
jgi:hypothetical protein